MPGMFWSLVILIVKPVITALLVCCGTHWWLMRVVSFFITDISHKCTVGLHVCMQLISPNNVATYGTLCALATFDRQEIQRHVLNSRFDLTRVLIVTACFQLWPSVRPFLSFPDNSWSVVIAFNCVKILDVLSFSVKDISWTFVMFLNLRNSLVMFTDSTKSW